MEITEVQIKLADDATAKVRAFATIVLDGCFMIRDIRVIEGTNGLFLAMPSRRLTARSEPSDVCTSALPLCLLPRILLRYRGAGLSDGQV